MYIDIFELKRDLKDYYGTAAFNGFPMAMLDVVKVENASDEEIVEMAGKAGMDLRKYQL